jgi:hypothetical protein
MEQVPRPKGLTRAHCQKVKGRLKLVSRGIGFDMHAFEPHAIPFQRQEQYQMVYLRLGGRPA